MAWRRIRSPVYLLTWCLPLAAAVVLALALWPVYRESFADLNKQVREAIAEEIQGLDEHYHEKGIEALKETIDLRVRAPADPDAVYLLLDSDGHKLAGNLAGWPNGVPRQERPWFSVMQTDGNDLEGRVFELYDNRLLLVGRRSPLRRIDQHLRTQLWSATIFGLIACGAIGITAILLFRWRISKMATRVDSIESGDLTQRLPLSGAGDELDELARRFNSAFDRIATLIDGTRHISSAIAHDMRRPVASLRNELDELSRDSRLEPASRERVNQALERIDEMLSTFSALLRLARIEAGSFGPRHDDIDLRAVWQDAVDLYEAVAVERGMHIAAQLEPATVTGDRDLLFQVAQNLLENAVRHGGGGIEVELRNGSKGSTSNIAHLTVRDHGGGVPPEALPHIFERFYRVDTARTSSGFGIGLALVKAIVELHGGRVRARNAEPGLAVEVELPSPA
ncbi:MAG TPA: HAMP domain-containing sensor histidine kinase [Steroidobacteraceae bacterium]|nr:HAMP domain-containing sensor histidine kinase [Steroidobacteraceae bacterium]